MGNAQANIGQLGYGQDFARPFNLQKPFVYLPLSPCNGGWAAVVTNTWNIKVSGGIPYGKEREKARGGRFERETWDRVGRMRAMGDRTRFDIISWEPEDALFLTGE